MFVLYIRKSVQANLEALGMEAFKYVFEVLRMDSFGRINLSIEQERYTDAGMCAWELSGICCSIEANFDISYV